MSIATRNVRVLSIFNLCIDFRLYLPVAVIYFARVSGSYALGASILSVTMLVSAIFDIPFGVLSDRMGRRKTVLMGSAANVLSMVFYAASSSYELLVIGAVLEGAGRALYNGNNSALLYDSLASENMADEYHRYSSKTASMFQIALTASALLGALVSVESLRWTLWASVVPQLIAFFVAFGFIEPPVHERSVAAAHKHVLQSIRNVRHSPVLRRLLLANFLGYGAGETSFSLSPVFVATLWPTWAVGIFRTMKHAFAMMSFWPTSRLIERLGAARLAFIASALDRGIGIVATAWATITSPVLLAITAFAYGPEMVATDVLRQQEFTDTERATMASLSTFVASVGFAVFAIAIGTIIDQHGARIGLLVAQVILTLTIPIYWSVHRQAQKNPRHIVD